MKNKIIAFLIILLVINIILLPNKKDLVNEPVEYQNKFSVSINGEIIFPGNYYFYTPTKLIDVINYAGGLTKDADTTNINLDEIISSNKVIIINKVKENTEQKNKYNLNTISFEELLKIPNITENRAANIIIYRNQNGLFKSVEELKLVKYIGESTYEKIKEYFTV